MHLDDDFLKWLYSPADCPLLEFEDICLYCVFSESVDCPLYGKK